MSAYRIRVTCPDCTYEDYQGCGDGLPWFVEDPKDIFKDRVFTDRDEAEAVADDMNLRREGGIWHHEVIEDEPAEGQPGAQR